MGSVGQRAAKLLAVNVGGLKKKSANRPRPHSKRSARVRTQADRFKWGWGQLADFFLRPQTLTASNFVTL